MHKMAAELKHFAAFGARFPKFTPILKENSRALVRKRFLHHGATFSRWKVHAQIVASSSIGEIRACLRQSVIRGFSRASEVAVDFNEERLKILSERGLTFAGDKSKTIGQPIPASHPHLLEEDETFVTIFLHFHGLEISSFNSGVTAFKGIQQNKPLTVESTSYHIVSNGNNNAVMELLKTSPPDLYPTPTRPRRGTPDSTFVTPGITKKEYRDRRHKLLSLLAKTHFGETHDRHLVIIPSNPIKYMTTDVPYPFRQNTDFLYLTGFQEPNAVLVLQSVEGQPFPAHKSTLFIHPQDPKRELWDGKHAGTKDAILFFGFDESYSIRNLPSVLTDRYAGKDFCVWYDHLRPTNPVIHDEISKVLFHSEKFTYKNLLILGHNTHMLRLIKSEAEIKLLRESASLTARAITKVMKSTRPGLEESHLHNMVEYECRMSGAERLAYPPVVASGPMANTLHYINNTQVLRDGELVLMDAGSEYHGYSSDITRTWPVSGKFSDAQRELYELVLRVHKKCLQLCQKEASLDYIHHAMLVLLGEELVKMDFLPKNLTESQLKKGAAEFCPHHVGHYLGMDTHDTHMVSRSLGLHPGMLITVEPGIYISQSNEKVPERYRGIGIRIEDDVLMTENGAEILTAECPKEVDEIERLMINTEMKKP